LQVNAIIEFTHRWIAAVATVLVVVLTAAAWLRQRRTPRIVAASTLAALLFLLQIALGALAVKYRLPGGIVMIHLANALLLLGMLTYVAVTARTADTAMRDHHVRFTALPSVAAGAAYLLVLSGALVVETGSSAGCAGWPLCGGGFALPSGELAVVNVVHRLVAGVVVLFIAGVMLSLVVSRRESRAVRWWAFLVCAIASLQVAAGALVVVLRLPPAAQAVHVALASALWASGLIVALVHRRHAPIAGIAAASGTMLVERRPVTSAGVAS
jgi:cytochrome c oxidase assembly protein subunit 15